MAAKKIVQTEEDVFGLALRVLGDVWADRVDKKAEKELFSRMAEVDGIQDYLRATLSDDVKRYFQASSEPERDQIRGAFNRTLYFRSLLKAPAPKKEEKPKKAKRDLGITRYG